MTICGLQNQKCFLSGLLRRRRAPVTLFIVLLCLRTSVSTSSGSTLPCLCCIWPRWSVSQHPSRLGSLVCMDHKCLWLQAGCRHRESDKQSEGRRKGKLACPSTPLSWAPPQAGTTLNQRAQLLSRPLTCTFFSSGVWDLLALSPWAKGISTLTSLWFSTFFPHLSTHLFTEDSALHLP